MRQRTTILLGVASGAAVGLVILFILLQVTGGSAPSPEERTEPPTGAVPADVPTERRGESVDEQDMRLVVLFFAGGDEFLLRPSTREIFWTSLVTDRARQIMQELLRGPEKGSPLRALLPEGVTLREVFVLPGGVAWVDLSAPGGRLAMGSLEERAAVEGIALSLTLNLPEIRRVGILIDGDQVESLAGHVDLRATYTGREWLPAGARLEDLLPESAKVEERPAEVTPAPTTS